MPSGGAVSFSLPATLLFPDTRQLTPDTLHPAPVFAVFQGISFIHNSLIFWAKFNRINHVTPPRFRTFVSYIFSVTHVRFYTQL